MHPDISKLIQEKYKDQVVYIKFDGLREINHWTLINSEGRVGDYGSLEKVFEILLNEKN